MHSSGVIRTVIAPVCRGWPSRSGQWITGSSGVWRVVPRSITSAADTSAARTGRRPRSSTTLCDCGTTRLLEMEGDGTEICSTARSYRDADAADLTPTRPQPGHGAGPGHRVGRPGRVPLGRPRRQERRRRRRRRGDAHGAVHRADGRRRRHRRGREGRRADAVQRRAGRRRHAAARRRRRRPDRRHDAHRPGPRQRPVGDRRQRAGVDVRPRPVVLHGEDRRRPDAVGSIDITATPDPEPALDRQGQAGERPRPDRRHPRPAAPRRPDRRGPRRAAPGSG